MFVLNELLTSEAVEDQFTAKGPYRLHPISYDFIDDMSNIGMIFNIHIFTLHVF